MTNEEFQSMQQQSAPTLTFGDAFTNVTGNEVMSGTQPTAEEAQQQTINMDDSMLSEAEKQAVEQFSKQIDIKNTTGILEYGSGVQKKMADFSQKTLDNVRTKDMGEVGELLTSVVAEVKNFDDSTEQKGFFGRARKLKNRVELMKSQYDKT